MGKPVSIGDDCWIGGGVTVLGGVTIGAGCVIGAGSLVTKVSWQRPWPLSVGGLRLFLASSQPNFSFTATWSFPWKCMHLTNLPGHSRAPGRFRASSSYCARL
jgi:carbonic anhydrase/acetyltransferase-like protein (isoleucine patch superfamily)